MTKYVIGLLTVFIMFLGSIVFRQNNTMVCHHFPIPEIMKEKSPEIPLYLFLFFSEDDCRPCLNETIEVLNALPPHFCVACIAPDAELKDEKALRKLTGPKFPLYSFREFKKYLPSYTPTLYGVSASGRIIFVLPGIQGQNINLENILLSTYGKISLSFEREQAGGENSLEKGDTTK